MGDTDLTSAQGLFDSKDGVQIVDVREPYEWDAGRIEGAVHVPLNDLMGGGGEFSAEAPVVVVCRSGNRSELATLMLRARGLDAHNLAEGMEGWEQAGFPITTPEGDPGRVA